MCKATGVKALRQSIAVKYPSASAGTSSSLRYEVDESKGEVRVYDETKVQLKEILPHVMKPKRAYNSFISPSSSSSTTAAVSISWKAISDHMQTRSIDDIRNYWMLKVVPLLAAYGPKKVKGSLDVQAKWTE